MVNYFFMVLDRNLNLPMDDIGRFVLIPASNL